MRVQRQTRRSAFTLVELLVVMAIIATLVALTTAGVMKYYEAATRAQAQHEIREMATGLEALRSDFKLSGYPPSKILLSNTRTDYDADAATQASLRHLTRMFPRMNWSDTTSPIQWRVPGASAPGGVWLEGHEALLFWLGGIPDNTVPAGTVPPRTGFSKNPANPTQLGGERFGPYFEFNASRIVTPGGETSRFIDPFGTQPFLYFSSGNTQNGYSPGDCSELGVQPFRQTSTRFVNANSFQIICAGPDMEFGQGGSIWSASNPDVGTPQGIDDYANFHQGPLGIGG